MSEKLLVPDIGDFEEVEIIEVLVKQGDQLNINDPIITIESDKSSVEIPSTKAGKIEKIEVKVGDKMIFSAGKSVEVYEIEKIRPVGRMSTNLYEVFVNVGSSKKWKFSKDGIKFKGK